MTKLPFTTLLAAIATAAVLPTAAFADDKSSALHQVMSKGMKEMQSMKMTGDIDRDFATMMKHHHQSGIEMAQVQARNGKDPEMRQQAQKIIESQKKEMAELDRWLQSKGKSSSSSSGSAAASGSSKHSGSSDHSGHGSK